MQYEEFRRMRCLAKNRHEGELLLEGASSGDSRTRRKSRPSGNPNAAEGPSNAPPDRLIAGILAKEDQIEVSQTLITVGTRIMNARVANWEEVKLCAVLRYIDDRVQLEDDRNSPSPRSNVAQPIMTKK